VSAIEDRKDVQWLFDQLDKATHESTINNVAFVIKLEVSDENEYTKDAELMERLRQCFAVNRKRVRDSQAADCRDAKD
jgi:hypothetical protein